MSADALARTAATGATGVVWQDPWIIGPVTVTDGVICLWAIDHAAASDNIGLMGWAVISGDDASTAIDALLADTGQWRREDVDDGVLITETESPVAMDADGYGWTYLFSDGEVRFADTRAALDFVTGPPA